MGHLGMFSYAGEFDFVAKSFLQNKKMNIFALINWNEVGIGFYCTNDWKMHSALLHISIAKCRANLEGFTQIISIIFGFAERSNSP